MDEFNTNPLLAGYRAMAGYGPGGNYFSMDPTAQPLPALDPAATSPLAMTSGTNAYNIPVGDFSSPAAPGGAALPWWESLLKGAIGTKEAPGWGGLAVGGASAGMNAFLGLKQYGLAKQALAENKRQFELNYNAQKSTTNTALEDRQRARVASNPGAYQSVGDYMNQNGIK